MLVESFDTQHLGLSPFAFPLFVFCLSGWLIIKGDNERDPFLEFIQDIH